MAHAKVIDRKALREYKNLLRGAKKRKPPVWTGYIKVDGQAGFPPNAKTAKIQYRLWSEYENTPLMIRIASDEKGLFSQELSGPSGVIELNVTGSRYFYISFSDPEVQVEVGILGYEF